MDKKEERKESDLALLKSVGILYWAQYKRIEEALRIGDLEEGVANYLLASLVIKAKRVLACR